MAYKKARRKQILLRQRNRRKKLKILRKRYFEAKSESERRKILAKAFAVSPSLDETQFLKQDK